MPEPLVSIITINYNGGDELRDTMRSVFAQDYRDYEYIIIDGGSSDGSLTAIADFEDRIDHWVSEPDQGIGDAMNKGISLCTGKHLLFLHSGDVFLDAQSLTVAVGFLCGSVDIHAFDIMYGNSRQSVRRKPRGMNVWLNLKTGLNHQATFCARAAFERIGGFDPEIRIAVDYEWFLRAYRAGLSSRCCDSAVTFMSDRGISSQTDPASLITRFAEERRIHYRHCNSSMLRLLYAAYWRLYPRYRGVSLPDFSLS